jgi:hypothetical protein
MADLYSYIEDGQITTRKGTLDLAAIHINPGCGDNSLRNRGLSAKRQKGIAGWVWLKQKRRGVNQNRVFLPVLFQQLH